MRLLLDSHVLLWTLLDDPKLSETARALVTNEGNEVFYSPVSLYELLFKATRGRMRPEAMLLLEAARDSGIEELGLTTPHLVHAARLDWQHGDPWDRDTARSARDVSAGPPASSPGPRCRQRAPSLPLPLVQPLSE